MEATAMDTTRAIMAILAMTIQDTTIRIMAMDKAMMITVVILYTVFHWTFNIQRPKPLYSWCIVFFHPLGSYWL